MTYTFYSDPGHGWLKVPVKELQRLGIAHRITPFSYRRGDFAYLEEDCDASLFLAAKKNIGEEFKINERVARTRDSKIRNYPRYF